MMKKLIYLLLIIFWLLAIFRLSSNNSNESNSLSKSLIDKGIVVYESVSGNNVDHEIIIKKLNYPVRKLAHFTIFLILGLFVYLFILGTNLEKKVIVSVLICFMCAVLDEFHQSFTGRTPLFMDVLIDVSGSFFGIFLLKSLQKHKNMV